MVLHHGGWRAERRHGQQLRRALAFVRSVQLGCLYEHTPIYAMNAASRAHGVGRAAVETFFGLAHATAAAWGAARQPGRDRAPCTKPRNGSDFAEWRRLLRGKRLTCPDSLRFQSDEAGIRPLDTCGWTAGVALLRRSVMRHKRDLPWFVPGEFSIVLHVRRGDIQARAPYRMVRKDNVTRLVGALGTAWERVRQAHPDLQAVLHVVTEPCSSCDDSSESVTILDLRKCAERLVQKKNRVRGPQQERRAWRELRNRSDDRATGPQEVLLARQRCTCAHERHKTPARTCSRPLSGIRNASGRCLVAAANTSASLPIRGSIRRSMRTMFIAAYPLHRMA